jgi:EAL domain-containing protein (putative c-di-GMP-specific phosphodiesterase class I)
VESIFIEKPEVAKNFINQCREMGISISLDDFGTGYSSLSYLQEFEFNTLKIDRKFVSTMLSNKKSMLLIKMIVGLAQKLNLEIIAEGVETEEEYEAIKAMGIECIQGYYFSKPIPFKLASEFLINGVV